MPDIALDNLSKKFGTLVAVDGATLTAADGELLTLLGPSGCGKTTTLRMIAGLEEPSGGSIRIGERVVYDRARGIDVPAEMRGLGMVFQSYAIWPHMTVAENIAYPLRMRHVGRAGRRELVDKVLDLVGLAGLGDKPSTLLSGGQQQRVALARALVFEPALLLLDEPLSNLDAKLREQMRFELRIMQQRVGLTAVYVTHDQEEALTLSDRLVVINHGEIEQIGTPIEVYERSGDPLRRPVHRQGEHDRRCKRRGVGAIRRAVDAEVWRRDDGSAHPVKFDPHRACAQDNSDKRMARRRLPPVCSCGRRRSKSGTAQEPEPDRHKPWNWPAGCSDALMSAIVRNIW